jgi:AcrR family transcriptional regulator
MVELSRKQREMERRAAEILRVARPILVREGFHALSMDRVASQMEYAKGTIYNHFPHKEEIVLALAAESMELRRKLFETAAATGYRSRQRMMAIGAACDFYTQHCHDDFVIEQWIRNHSVWDKSSQQRQNFVRQCEGQCMSIVAGVVRDAVTSGELSIPEDMTAEEFVYGFWALTYGSQVLAASSPSLPALGIVSPVRAIRVHCGTLMNGFRWLPAMEMMEHLAISESLEAELGNQFRSLKALNTPSAN